MSSDREEGYYKIKTIDGYRIIAYWKSTGWLAVGSEDVFDDADMGIESENSIVYLNVDDPCLGQEECEW